MISRSRKHFWTLFFGIALICFAQTLQAVPLVQSAPLLAITPTGEPPTPMPPTSEPEPTPTAVEEPPPDAEPTPQPTQIQNERDKADPRVTKSVDHSDVQIGDVIVFTLRVTNTGDETAENVVVTDSMPGFLDILDVVSSKGSVTVSGRDVRVNVGTVAHGEVVIINIQARVNESATLGEGSNRANLVASNRSDNPSNNTSTVLIRIRQSDPTPTPELGTPTETPLPEMPTETPVPAPSPTVVPPQPARMPQTSGADQGVIWFLTTLGLLLIGLSVWMRRSNI
jgi:uncharacterized repeat protein (TIGR01451 family)